jgi:predicted RNase H-like HicB family nuclease
MNELIFLIDNDLESGYNARSLNYPIFTQGDTIDELKSNIKDAVFCHFDDLEKIPKVIRLHFVHEEILTYA